MQNRRSRAREVALQLLFQHDQNTQPMTDAVMEAFVRDRLQGDEESSAFCRNLLRGTLQNRERIDAKISDTAENWKLHRMLAVDRNVLRLATYELAFAPEPTPPTAAINEAVELARRFGSLDSPGFVNGVLDKIARPEAAGA